MARHDRNRRNVDGVLLLDKPVGLTSNQALQTVKRLFEARKAGHTGSLDPLASGLLPLCFGEATKLSGFLLDADKHYWVRMRLGVTTDTGDADGEILATQPVGALDTSRLQGILQRYVGEIEQIPPMYSAIRHKGRRLYELARSGEHVEREPRRVVIYRLALVGLNGDEVEVEVHCSKGTYVRTLVEDIGAALGCGAHVVALRRTAVGPYGSAGMVTLDRLRRLADEGGSKALDALLLPVESALQKWPDVQLTDDAAYYLKMGQPVLVPRAPTAGWVRLYSRNRRFLGVGEILDDGRVAPRRLLRMG